MRGDEGDEGHVVNTLQLSLPIYYSYYYLILERAELLLLLLLVVVEAWFLLLLLLTSLSPVRPNPVRSLFVSSSS